MHLYVPATLQAFIGAQMLLGPTTLATIDLGTQIALMLALGDLITLVA